MVGATVYDERIYDRDHKPNCLCTVSDEAFTLLTIENVYHRWIEIFRVNDYVTLPPKEFKTIKDKLCKDFDSLYTLSGQNNAPDEEVVDTIPMAKPKRKKKGPGKGWTEEGMQRYNELYQAVKADRLAFPQFMHDLCKKERDKVRRNECNTMNKKRKAVTLAVHEDFILEDTQDPQDPAAVANEDSDSELENDEDVDSSDKEVPEPPSESEEEHSITE